MEINIVIITGEIIRNPELRSAGKWEVVSMNCVHKRTFQKRDGEEATDMFYFDVNFWGRKANEVSQAFFKGDKVLVEGQLKYDGWTDRDTGEKKGKLVINGQRIVGIKTMPKSLGNSPPQRQIFNEESLVQREQNQELEMQITEEERPLTEEEKRVSDVPF